jgi:hypothetical protein
MVSVWLCVRIGADIVMQYLCLFWGSDNLMYTNCCILSEYVISTDASTKIISPRYPCHSFCVQVCSWFVCLFVRSFVRCSVDVRDVHYYVCLISIYWLGGFCMCQ